MYNKIKLHKNCSCSLSLQIRNNIILVKIKYTHDHKINIIDLEYSYQLLFYNFNKFLISIYNELQNYCNHDRYFYDKDVIKLLLEKHIFQQIFDKHIISDSDLLNFCLYTKYKVLTDIVFNFNNVFKVRDYTEDRFLKKTYSTIINLTELIYNKME